MTTEVWSQFVSQTSEKTEKLFDLTSRMDERLKLIDNNQEKLHEQIESHSENYLNILKKMAVIEAHQTEAEKNFNKIHELEKRLSQIELYQGTHSERWKTIANFLLQLIWAILAAYVLTKLNLQSANLP